MVTLILFNSRKNAWFVAYYLCAYSSFWARFTCERSVVMKIKVDSEWNLLLLCKHDVVNLFCLCGIKRIIGIGIRIIIYQIMVNKCCVVGCRSNYKGEEIVPVFSFPSDEKIGRPRFEQWHALNALKANFWRKRRTKKGLDWLKHWNQYQQFIQYLRKHLSHINVN